MMQSNVAGSKAPEAMLSHIEDVPIDFADPHRAALDDNPETAERPSLATLLAIISLALSYMTPISFGFTLVTSILVPISVDLGDQNNRIVWLIGGWSIASSVSFSIAGGLSDVFGRRWIIIAGELCNIIGSAVAATAQSINQIIVGSTLLGFGCGIIFVSYAGISELLPNKWRSVGLALTELFISVPCGVGSVLIAYVILERTALGWRWCYYAGLIVGVVSLLGTVAFYFPPSRPRFDLELTRWQEFKQIDFVGVFLYTVGLTVFLVGLTWAGTPDRPWNSISVIVPIVVGVVTFAACFVYDFTVASHPIFPWPVFRLFRDYTVCLGIAFVAGLNFYPFLGLFPQVSLFVFTNDPWEIGRISLPSGVVQFFFAVVAVSAMGRIGHLKAQIVFGMVIQTIFTAACAATLPSQKIAWAAVQAFAIGPFALVVLGCYIIAGLNIPLKNLGLATGLIGTFRSLGGSLGNAIYNTIIQGTVNKDLGPAVAEAALSRGFNSQNLDALIPAAIQSVVGVPHAFDMVPGINAAVEEAVVLAIRGVYTKAFRLVFYASIPFGVIATILALLIRDPSQYLTNHTAIHMEQGGMFDKDKDNGQAGRSERVPLSE